MFNDVDSIALKIQANINKVLSTMPGTKLLSSNFYFSYLLMPININSNRLNNQIKGNLVFLLMKIFGG